MEEKRKYFHPTTLVLVGIIIAALMVLFAFFEIANSKARIRRLITDKGEILIEQVEKDTALSIRASEKNEEELSERLLSAARTVSFLEARLQIEHEFLESVARMHSILTIHVVDIDGRIESSNREPEHFQGKAVEDFRTIFPELYSGEKTESVLGLHFSAATGEPRFSAAVKRASGGIIVAGENAKTLVDFRRSFGFGRLIQDLGHLRGVHQAVLQDSDGVIAASQGITQVESLSDEPFLRNAMETGLTRSRLTRWEDVEVFEVVRSIRVASDLKALLRIAFDAREFRELNQKATRRLGITVVALALLLASAVNGLIIYQNMNLIRKTRDEIASFSDAVLRGMADGVLVVSFDGSIKMMNEQAGRMFPGTEKALPSILSRFVSRIHTEESPVFGEVETGGASPRMLVVSGSQIKVSESEGPFVVLICRDETEMREMEKQIRRNEKAVAMGRLAGSVAHEIRNPLNAIGMTIQRLGSEFAPKSDEKEYLELLRIVAEEMRRLDEIVGQFLQFARAPVIQPAPDDLAQLAASVVSELRGLSDERLTQIAIQGPPNLRAVFDSRKLRQVLLNVLTNALDALSPGGKVSIEMHEERDVLWILVSDDGKGMTAEEMERIFDPYFSTKEKGTGLGLPIALRIVQAHGGALTIDSALGKGTRVQISLPKRAET